MSLPSGYKRLEYIKSTGTQYINTGLNYGNSNFTNLRLVADSIIGTAPNGWAVSGVGALTCFYYGCGNNSRVIYYGNGNSDVSTGVTFTEKRSIFDLSHKSKTFKVTEVESSNVLLNLNITLGTPSHSAKPIYLFAYHDSSRNVAYCHGETLYGCKIYDNDVLVRDFIPCKTTAGNVGLWDDVNSVFYGNAGTGTFTAGPVVASPSIFVNIDGIWKPINHIYVNINNIWQKST